MNDKLGIPNLSPNHNAAYTKNIPKTRAYGPGKSNIRRIKIIPSALNCKQIEGRGCDVSCKTSSMIFLCKEFWKNDRIQEQLSDFRISPNIEDGEECSSESSQNTPRRVFLMKELP